MTEPAVTRSGAAGFLGLDRRGWPGTIAVALIVAVVAVGLPILDRLVPAEQPLAAGTVVLVGRGVSFTTVAGWSRDAADAGPRRDRVRLTDDAVSFVVEASASDRTLAEEFERLAEEIHDSSGAQLFNDAVPLATDSGLIGIGGSYGSPESDGRFAVFEAGGTVVRVVAKGPPGAVAAGLDDVSAMVASLRVADA